MTARFSLDAPLACANPELSKGWPARRPPSLAVANAHAALEAQARRTVRAMIKDLAWAYAREPWQLDGICEGLATMTPNRLIAILRALIANPPRNRWFAFGGETTLINLRGALLHARWCRAIASRNARRTA